MSQQTPITDLPARIERLVGEVEALKEQQRATAEIFGARPMSYLQARAELSTVQGQLASARRWTTETPKHEGWYWWRKHRLFKPLIVHLFYDAQERTVRCDTEFAAVLAEQNWGGEWSSEKIPEPFAASESGKLEAAAVAGE